MLSTMFRGNPSTGSGIFGRLFLPYMVAWIDLTVGSGAN